MRIIRRALVVLALASFVSGGMPVRAALPAATSTETATPGATEVPSVSATATAAATSTLSPTITEVPTATSTVSPTATEVPTATSTVSPTATTVESSPTPEPDAEEQPEPNILQVAGIQEGQTISGKITIQARVENTDRVTFELLGAKHIIQVERYEPFVFGGDDGTNPNGWDTTTVPNGDYVLIVTAQGAMAERDYVVVHFTIRNEGSASPDATRFAGLTEGQTASNTMYIRVRLAGEKDEDDTSIYQAERIKSVRYVLYNADENIVLDQTVSIPPFGLGGPKGWNTTVLADGTYRLVGVITNATGKQDSIQTVFTIANKEAQAPPSCSTSLQSLIDRTPSGGTLQVPTCLFREAVTVRKPMTIVGAGAEIRGSEVWSVWTKSGSDWKSKNTVPFLSSPESSRCKQPRCAWPQQAFRDGKPLLQVRANPATGQFAISSGHVVLGDNPAGHTIEVTVRTRWMLIDANNVTLRGLRMRHAGNKEQTGALEVNGKSDVTIDHVVVSDAHGAVVKMGRGDRVKLINSDIFRGGNLGVHGGSAGDDHLVANNTIHDNNTEGYRVGWEGGGYKGTHVHRATFQGNEVYGNNGPGLWCDIDCTNVTYTNNRIHNNDYSGIWWEISDNAVIANNVIYQNGYGYDEWGWGAGILIASSRGADVYKNIVAWNADGISVISQNRGNRRWNTVTGNHVHDNIIIQAHGYALAWLDDHNGPTFQSGSDNKGWSNQYWLWGGEDSQVRFAWKSGIRTLTAFNQTPGEQHGSYISTGTRNSILANASVPQRNGRMINVTTYLPLVRTR